MTTPPYLSDERKRQDHALSCAQAIQTLERVRKKLQRPAAPKDHSYPEPRASFAEKSLPENDR